MAEEKKKVLIVEDDKFIAEVYVTKLNREGFDVILAGDGEDALAKIKRERPDMVLLDILMPKMDGMEMMEKLSQDDELKNIKVIFLTNANEKDFVDKALEAGAVDYLVKSNYTPDEVVKKIREKM